MPLLLVHENTIRGSSLVLGYCYSMSGEQVITS
jgi:hypothetical protein